MAGLRIEAGIRSCSIPLNSINNTERNAVTKSGPEFAYALGYTTEEHDRLMRQSELVAPCTERLFRVAGIGRGDRVLDVGSGIGDVSLLLRSLVGPTGEVVGIERDAGSIARATARIEAAGFNNVLFFESDVAGFSAPGSFDAIVGRFILMYLPDPVEALRSLTKLLRPKGVIAFLEPSMAAVQGLSAHLPLYSAFKATIIDAFKLTVPTQRWAQGC